MIILKKTCLVCISTLSLVACQSGEADKTYEASQSASADIRAASALWVDTYNRNDWAALGMLFAENAVMMPPNGDMVAGRSAIEAWEAEYETNFRIVFQIDAIEVDRTMAFVRGRSCIFIPDGLGEYGVDVGKFLEVRRLQDDGQWLIEVDAFNSDLPVGSDFQDVCPFASLPEPSTQ